ncbi:MAG: alkaline phosphatase D family protein [Chitinophagaceae bacterium]|nr:alkaline phosphatase D family protein [Chitinophagaceae bacterium]
MYKAKPLSFFFLLTFFSCFVFAQPGDFIISGPMHGQVELRTAKIWVEVKPAAPVELWYWKKGDIKNARKVDDAGAKGTDKSNQYGFRPVVFDVTGLDINTTYEYQLTGSAKNSRPTKAHGEFTTKDLWQWRKPAPDFSFLAGSCSYFNEPVYDRPGKPYGGDSSIFETMAREKAAFMLWLGDNWYTRDVDYLSAWGLWYRASRDRSFGVLQNFLKSMSHYAIWDDHDFGPNDMGKEYVLKEESRKVFMNYWANPSYGEYGKGVYSKISYGDVDLFLLDDRTFRSNDNLQDSIDGNPNPIKKMFGSQQMEWLKNALSGSFATFKIIATGSQVLNPVSPFDCFRKFPVEYNELMGFLEAEKISGVLFLTGDRHHSEIIKTESHLSYPLYDITSSPLTSGTHKFGAAEKNNPYRVVGVDEKQNYARITVTGKYRERNLKVEFIGIKGEKLAEWSVSEKDLKVKE